MADQLSEATINIEDYRRLAPALSAHEAEWISAGKLRQCIARWLEGADFTDPAQREWEGSVPERTAKEELCDLLREAMILMGGMPLSDFQALRERIKRRLELEKML